MNLAVDPLISASAGLLVGLILVGAASHKWTSKYEFRSVLSAYRVLPESSLDVASVIVPATESLIFGLLLWPTTRVFGAMAAVALFTLYSAAIGLNISRGRSEIDCGCSWAGHGQSLSAWLIARNGVLIALATVAAFASSDRALGVLDVVVVLAAAACGLLFYHAADRLIANGAKLRTLRSAT